MRSKRVEVWIKLSMSVFENFTINGRFGGCLSHIPHTEIRVVVTCLPLVGLPLGLTHRLTHSSAVLDMNFVFIRTEGS